MVKLESLGTDLHVRTVLDVYFCTYWTCTYVHVCVCVCVLYVHHSVYPCTALIVRTYIMDELFTLIELYQHNERLLKFSN